MKNKPPFSLRQGDVLVLEAAYLGTAPQALKDITPKKGRVVLQFGEVTGHAHAFYDDSYNVKLYVADGGARYLHVEALAKILHEEHSTADVPAGKYLLPQQVEYTPAELRRVAD